MWTAWSGSSHCYKTGLTKRPRLFQVPTVLPILAAVQCFIRRRATATASHACVCDLVLWQPLLGLAMKKVKRRHTRRLEGMPRGR